jgi:hypothetical protein
MNEGSYYHRVVNAEQELLSVIELVERKLQVLDTFDEKPTILAAG